MPIDIQPREEVDYIYEPVRMTPEEIIGIDEQFKEKYPEEHQKLVETFSLVMGKVDAISPVEVFSGSQGFKGTPAIFGIELATKEVRSASARYIVNSIKDINAGAFLEAINKIAELNPKKDRRPTI